MTGLDEFTASVKGKNITVIGIGISNLPLIKYLVKLGAHVKACDRKRQSDLGEIYDELKALGVLFSLGDGYLSDISGDIIFKTPGMRFDTPELLAEKEKGTVITSEMEVFFDVCPSHIIAVTGSDGKTTTTTLIHKMMTEAGYKTWLGGNIGHPLLAEAENMENDDWVILELSSFQLHTMRKSPEIAVITNISPNHLDMHKGYQEYIDAKKNIMLYQNSGSILVVNADNEVTNDIGKEARGKVKCFSRRENAHVCLDGDMIRCGENEVLNINDISVPGMHNVENYMAAIAAVEGLVPDDIIVKIAKEFKGVEHRIELVREVNGVKYYNSSIDSSPNRTINTLSVFPQKVIMISGGKDKGIAYDEIGPVIAEHVKSLILAGPTSGAIKTALMNSTGHEGVKITELGDYKKEAEAARKDSPAALKALAKSVYEKAVRAASNEAKSGDIVLLSPASTSFDMFKNFEERGHIFKDIVNSL